MANLSNDDFDLTPSKAPSLSADDFDLTQTTQQNPPLLSRIGGDIASGAAEGGQLIRNLPYNFNKFMFGQKYADIAATPPDEKATGINKALTYLSTPKATSADYSSSFVNKPNLADKLLQGSVSAIPSIFATGGVGLAELPAQGALMGLGEGQGEPLTNMLKGASASTLSKPVAAVIGNAISGAGTGLGYLLGGKNSSNKIGNILLNYLRGAQNRGAALSPAEASENYANYTDKDSNPLPVDIGKLVNNGNLNSAYNATRYMPFSGATQKSNMVTSGLGQKEISEAQDALEQAKTISPEASELQSKLSEADKQDPFTDALLKNVNELSTNKAALDKQIDSSKDLLSSLPGSLDKSNLNDAMGSTVKGAYNRARSEAAINYKPINEASDVRIDNLQENPFPSYSDTAKDLLNKREHLNQIFGSDSDLGRMLNSELDKAAAPLKSKDATPVTLGDAVSRIQNLGKLAAAAGGQGYRAEARNLSNLGTSLSNDTDSLLRNSGSESLADSLQNANEHYRNNVVPFWNTNEIRRTALEKNYTPNSVKLSSELHNPNNDQVMNLLPDDTKNAALYSLITKGKGTSSGESNLMPSDIAHSYGNLPVSTKNIIKSYNPNADSTFENLRDNINDSASLQTNRDALSKQLLDYSKQQQKYVTSLRNKATSLSKEQQTNIATAEQQVEQAKQNRYTLPNQSTPESKLLNLGILGLGSHFLGKAFGVLPPAMMASRATSKLLTNPELINAYLSNTLLPVRKNTLNPVIARLLQSVAAPGALQ